MNEPSLKGILTTAALLKTLVFLKEYSPMNDGSLGRLSDELDLLIEDLKERIECGEN